MLLISFLSTKLEIAMFFLLKIYFKSKLKSLTEMMELFCVSSAHLDKYCCLKTSAKAQKMKNVRHTTKGQFLGHHR